MWRWNSGSSEFILPNLESALGYDKAGGCTNQLSPDGTGIPGQLFPG